MALSTNPPATKYDEEVDNSYQIVFHDNTDLWDQLRAIMREQKYTTQDHASVALMQEFPNVHPFFAVRRRDNLLIGAIINVETDELIYGNVYVVREGFRGDGLGLKMVMAMLDRLHDVFSSKPWIGRSVLSMLKAYMGPPFFVKRLYNMHINEFSNKKELKEFFPERNVTDSAILVDVKDMNERDFQALLDYDKKVTGVDRSKFLKEYFSIDFVHAVALMNSKGEVVGLAGAVPTFEEGLYKVAPIFASSPEDAGALVSAVCDQVDHPNAHFVFHVRTGSAGDWVLERSKLLGRTSKHVSVTCESTYHGVDYEEKCRPEFMFAPTNSPVHFDA